MNRTFHIAMAMLVSYGGVFSSAQTTAPPTEQKPESQTTSSDSKQETPPAGSAKAVFGSGSMSASSAITQAAQAAQAARARAKATAAMGPLVILTDTKGVDFGPYFQRVLHDVRINWYNLIPESARAPLMKKGKLVIEFSILKDGTVTGMKLVDSSGDVALDSAAWRGVKTSNPFPPLPNEFSGQYIALRFTFFYNPDRADLEVGALASPTGQSSSKSGIKVSIAPTDGGKVPIGGSEVVDATVTGSTNTAVKWSLTGVGCSGSACGMMSGDLYLAPKVLPSPPSVVLTATSEADSTASAWVTVQLMKPDSPR
jgi:TonB family protein